MSVAHVTAIAVKITLNELWLQVIILINDTLKEKRNLLLLDTMTIHSIHICDRIWENQPYCHFFQN